MSSILFKGSYVFRFQKDIMVDGKPFKAGAHVAASDIPAGCLESCLHTGAVRKLTDAELQEYQRQKAIPTVVQSDKSDEPKKPNKPDAKPADPAAKK